MALTINPRTGRTLVQAILDHFAKLDACLSLLTPEDEEALGMWILETGADVSATSEGSASRIRQYTATHHQQEGRDQC